MTEMITSFTGEHEPLSNFNEQPFWMPATRFVFQPPASLPGRVWFNSAEAAFQAHKATSWAEALRVINAPSPYMAKRTGRQITCRQDWEQTKRTVMMECLLAKFGQHTALADVLRGTWPLVLVEGNHWGDKNWGAIPATRRLMEQGYPLWRPDPHDQSTWLAGHNWLGLSLAMVRELIV